MGKCHTMKNLIKKIPIIGSVARILYRLIIKPKEVPFTNSDGYWKERYRLGGNSGAGSYEKFAEFKAMILNDFVQKNGVQSVIEYGCGDGNQLKQCNYPQYLGFDISPEAIARCKSLFSSDAKKTFKSLAEWSGEHAQLTISLEVIYHLIEDEVFNEYMTKLFSTSDKFVIIYSSDKDDNSDNNAVHVRHRKFTTWVSAKVPDWKLLSHIPNIYPFKGNPNSGSFADFFIYAKAV